MILFQIIATTAMPSDPSDPEAGHEAASEGPQSPGRRQRAFAFVLMVVVVSVVFHRPLLRVAFGILVAHQPAGDCNVAMIATPNGECFDLAAERLKEGAAEKVLLVEPRPVRPVRIGAMPRAIDTGRDELMVRGVEASQIVTIETDAATPHELFRRLDPRVAESDWKVSVITTSTLSRYYRRVIDQSLGVQRGDRYRLAAVDPPGVTANQWWQSRSAVAQVLNHTLRLAFVTFHGESKVDDHDPYAHVWKPGLKGSQAH